MGDNDQLKELQKIIRERTYKVLAIKKGPGDCFTAIVSNGKEYVFDPMRLADLDVPYPNCGDMS